MDYLTVVLLGIGLAMDAFAVSVCKGLAMGRITARAAVVIGTWFGFFQFLMPLIGFYLGQSFHSMIADYDHWIAFGLLALIGCNMIRESFFGDDESKGADIGFLVMLVLAIATSIDAFAVGISMAMDGEEILLPAAIIGIITFAISVLGVKAGSIFGDRLGSRAELLGGIILILIGIKVVLEHTGFL